MYLITHPPMSVHNFQEPHPWAANHNLGLAKQLVGRHVKINRGGPDKVDGWLAAVNGEVLVIQSGKTIVYVNGKHVKSITEGTSKGRGGRTGHASKGHSGQDHGKSGAGYISASTIKGVLDKMHQKFIQINRGGPEKLEGFLADTHKDFILLIVGREHVRIPIFHIKTVNLSGKSEGKSGGSGDGKGGSSGKRSSGKQSDGKRSDGKRSDGKGRHNGDGRDNKKNRNKKRC